jgi:hypothetical protein
MQPTQALLKRFRKLPLTTKDINKGYYKGTRTGSMGRHTKYGGYIIDWNKVRTYVVPAGLDTFKVCFYLSSLLLCQLIISLITSLSLSLPCIQVVYTLHIYFYHRISC